MTPSQLAERFRALHGVQPAIFTAPGRVNLIGEHTDYNDGWVMPCAIGFAAHVAIAPRKDAKLVMQSEEFPQRFEFDIRALPEKRTGNWCDYVLGVAVALRQSGRPPSGANILISSDVPTGSGLSSSAALEVSTACAFLSLQGASMPRPEIAQLCRHAENSFVGAHVGIMDQFVSCLGKAGHALLLDCRSLEFKTVPIPEGVRIVICNTMVKHELSGGEYNRRREECDEGVRMLSRWYPAIRALRDVSAEQVERHRTDLPDIIYRRCLHVAAEDERVTAAVAALESGDLGQFGKLMRQSHHSLRHLYEVSCHELDVMVELAEQLSGCYGARMTGGGFGGCTVNLVRSGDADSFSREIAERYQQTLGIHPDVYVCSAADGAHPETDF